MSENIINNLEKLLKNEYTGDDLINHMNQLLDVSIEDIKKDCDKKIILNTIMKIDVITFSDKKLIKEHKRELYKLYTDAKELVVKYRKNKLKCVITISDEFDLKINHTELSYFILIMYYVGIKLNDTFPMIPGLFKQLLPLCNIEHLFNETEECMSNKSTNWTELEINEKCQLMTYEYEISYDSLNNIKYNNVIKSDLTSTLYVSEENANKIYYQERLVFSKYFNPRYEMIIIC